MLEDGKLDLEALAKLRRGDGTGGFGFVVPPAAEGGAEGGASSGEATIDAQALMAVAARAAVDMKRANLDSASAKAQITAQAGKGAPLSASATAASATSAAAFEGAAKWGGARAGWCFGKGDQGVGYYRDYLPECLHHLRAHAAEELKAYKKAHAGDSDSGGGGGGGGRGGSGDGGSGGQLPASVLKGASLVVQFDAAATRGATAKAAKPQQPTTLPPLPRPRRLRADPSAAALADRIADAAAKAAEAAASGVDFTPSPGLPKADTTASAVAGPPPPPPPPGPPPLPPGPRPPGASMSGPPPGLGMGPGMMADGPFGLAGRGTGMGKGKGMGKGEYYGPEGGYDGGWGKGGKGDFYGFPGGPPGAFYDEWGWGGKGDGGKGAHMAVWPRAAAVAPWPASARPWLDPGQLASMHAARNEVMMRLRDPVGRASFCGRPNQALATEKGRGSVQI